MYFGTKTCLPNISFTRYLLPSMKWASIHNISFIGLGLYSYYSSNIHKTNSGTIKCQSQMTKSTKKNCYLNSK